MIDASLRERAIQKIADSEGVDHQEAEELFDSLIPHINVEDSPVEEEPVVETVETDPVNDEVTLQNTLLDLEMESDLAFDEGNAETQTLITSKYEDTVRKLSEIRREKVAAPYNTLPGGDQMSGQPPAGQEQEGVINCPMCGSANLSSTGQTHECQDCGMTFDIPIQNNQHLTSMKKEFPNINENLLKAAYKKASAFTDDPHHLKNLIAFFIGQSDQRSTYAAVRNLDSPLLCPGCSKKVARDTNPLHFVCEEGHVSELNLEKVGSPYGEVEQGGGWTGEPMGDLMVNENAPYMSEPAGPEVQPEGPATPGTLRQDQKNRLANAFQQAQAESGSYHSILGIADGFFGTDLFSQLAASQGEQADYQYGRRQGDIANAGESNTLT